MVEANINSASEEQAQSSIQEEIEAFSEEEYLDELEDLAVISGAALAKTKLDRI